MGKENVILLSVKLNKAQKNKQDSTTKWNLKAQPFITVHKIKKNIYINKSLHKKIFFFSFFASYT